MDWAKVAAKIAARAHLAESAICGGRRPVCGKQSAPQRQTNGKGEQSLQEPLQRDTIGRRETIGPVCVLGRCKGERAGGLCQWPPDWAS